MATPTVTMDALMTELSGRLGETSTPSGVDNRKQFLQRSYEEAWKAYPWPFSQLDTTLEFSGGVAELPDDFLDGGSYTLLKDGKEFTELDYGDRSRPGFYISYDSGYTAVLVDTADFSGEFRYQYTPPNLLTTTGGPYPNSGTLVDGAMRFLIKADNPEADNAQEIAIFEQSLRNDIIPFNRSRNRQRRVRTISDVYGHHTGDY